MLLRLLELSWPIDEVIFCDTYKEFPAMYEHVAKIHALVEQSNIKFTELRAEKDFDYYMFEHQPKRKNAKYAGLLGYSWAGARTRWCSQLLKLSVIDSYINSIENVVQYVGIAADETYRLERKITQRGERVYPLVEWGWTEQDCLDYCYSLGYNWDGLYQHFKRVSCWCCPLKSLDELRNMRKYYPELWQQLIEMDNRTWRQYRADYSVEQLDKRFAFEEEFAASGKSIRSREFFKQLKEQLEG